MNRVDETMTAGTTAHREFRDLDIRRLPTAPPRPGSAALRETSPADPIIAELAAIHATTAAAHLPDADVHARRLRALADSPILDGSIADWLNELADLIDYQHA